MTSFSRKIKRKKMAAARKQFMKHFKSSMQHFKKSVKCSLCGRPPREGENIDNWRINKNSENIDLICTECYTIEESEDSNENHIEF